MKICILILDSEYGLTAVIKISKKKAHILTACSIQH